MQDYTQSTTRPSMNDQIMSHGDPNGIIMVESNPHAHKAQANIQADPVAGKKKNKKKKGKVDSSENPTQSGNTNQQQQVTDRMVTLKNPMFFNNPAEPINSMMRNIQTPPFVSPLAEPPTASIVRNENGMYTIRNPTFQNAFGASSPSPAFAPKPQMEPVGRQYPPGQFSNFENDAQPVENSLPKCSSVIGSEMKNVLQRRKEQEYAANMDPYNPYGMRQQSTYSHFGGTGVNFNNNGTHCDDSFLQQPSSSAFQSFPSSMMTNYDDLRLQPGQMLNSEVKLMKLKFVDVVLKISFNLGHNSQR